MRMGVLLFTCPSEVERFSGAWLADVRHWGLSRTSEAVLEVVVQLIRTCTGEGHEVVLFVVGPPESAAKNLARCAGARIALLRKDVASSVHEAVLEVHELFNPLELCAWLVDLIRPYHLDLLLGPASTAQTLEYDVTQLVAMALEWSAVVGARGLRWTQGGVEVDRGDSASVAVPTTGDATAISIAQEPDFYPRLLSLKEIVSIKRIPLIGDTKPPSAGLHWAIESVARNTQARISELPERAGCPVKLRYVMDCTGEGERVASLALVRRVAAWAGGQIDIVAVGATSEQALADLDARAVASLEILPVDLDPFDADALASALAGKSVAGALVGPCTPVMDRILLRTAQLTGAAFAGGITALSLADGGMMRVTVPWCDGTVLATLVRPTGDVVASVRVDVFLRWRQPAPLWSAADEPHLPPRSAGPAASPQPRPLRLVQPSLPVHPLARILDRVTPAWRYELAAPSSLETPYDGRRFRRSPAQVGSAFAKLRDKCLYCADEMVTLGSWSRTRYGGPNYDRGSDNRGLNVCPHCGWWCVHHETRTGGEQGGDWSGVTQYYLARGVLRSLQPTIAGLDLEVLRRAVESRGAGMTWTQLEDVVATIFRDHGFRVRCTTRSGEDGHEMVAAFDGPGDALIGVEVRRRRQKIDIETIRDFMGSLTARGITRGVYVTTSDYTSDASDAAGAARVSGHFVKLVSGQDLLERLEIPRADHAGIVSLVGEDASAMWGSERELPLIGECIWGDPDGYGANEADFEYGRIVLPGGPFDE